MKRNRTLAVMTAASIIALTGCGVGSDTTPNPSSSPAPVQVANTDPTKGWVTVLSRSVYQKDFDNSGGSYASIGLAKFCDRTTLLYLTLTYDGSAPGVTAIQNSPECQR